MNNSRLPSQRIATLIKNTSIAICYVCSLAVPSISNSQPSSEIQKELRDTVSLWANAWSSQDAESYFGFYTDEYFPPAFTSRNVWINNRTSRIESPASIRIRLFDFGILDSSANSATVQLRLIYERPGYGDQTLKELELIKRNDEWQIIRESNISVQRIE